MDEIYQADCEEYAVSLLKSFDVDSFCFKNQAEFIRDKSRFKTAVCSRRAGKTVSCAAHLISVAINKPKAKCLYITLTRLNAKRILWEDLLEINRNFELQGIPNEAELVLKFPNSSQIFLAGANDKSEIEKFRGLALNLVYIDEAQSFPAFLEDLVDQVLTKALFDHHGTLCLIGTPGAVPVGYFHKCSKSESWSHHSWTMFDNPHLERKSGKKPIELVEEDIKRMGVSIDSPKIRRECYGEWAHDEDALVFCYQEEKNSYTSLPANRFTWNYIYGIDLGFNDADAIAILGWQEHSDKLYLVHEETTKKQGITELVARIKALQTKYEPHSMVIDAGALGKKIAHEIQTRHELAVEAADKTRKLEYIELMNDALRTRHLYVPRGGLFANDALQVEWDMDAQPPHSKISERFHSDIADALLYAYRKAYHWLETPFNGPKKHGTKEWSDEQERIHEEQAMRVIDQEENIWADMGHE